jgi:PhnB protein
MMNLAPQLAFAGQCRQAFEFYAKLLGDKITVMNTFGGSEDRKLPPGSVAAADIRSGSRR